LASSRKIVLATAGKIYNWLPLEKNPSEVHVAVTGFGRNSQV